MKAYKIKLINSLLFIFCFINTISAQYIDTVYHTDNSPLTYNSVNTVVTDANNTIWIGTEYGLNQLSPTGWQSWFAESSNLPGDAIRALSVDNDNTLWIGVFQIKEEKNKNHMAFYQNDSIQLWEKPTELSDFVRDILFIEDSIKTMFLATSSGLGIYTFQNEQWQVYDMSNIYLVSPHITSLAYLANDGLYAGTINGGLINLKENGNINVLFGEDIGLPDNTILDVAVDTAGLLWLATPEGGLVSYNGQTFNSINPNNSDMPSRSISSIAITKQNQIWCGTFDAGIVLLNENGIRIFNTDNSILRTNKINDLHLQNDSIIWAATDMGLARIYTSDKMLSTTAHFPALEADLACPNPSNGYLTISNKHFLNKLTVYNAKGFVVYKSLKQSSNINLSHLPKGIYFLNLKTTSALYVQKIIITQ